MCSQVLHIHSGEGTNFTGNIPVLIGTEITQNTPQNAGLSISMLDSRVYLHFFLAQWKRGFKTIANPLKLPQPPAKVQSGCAIFHPQRIQTSKKKKRIAQKAV